MTDKPHRYNWQVRLASWANDHNHHRLRGTICTWWTVRNWWKHNIWWPFEHRFISKPWWWLRARVWGCHKHERPYPYMGIPFLWKYCFRCTFDDLHRKARVQELTQKQ